MYIHNKKRGDDNSHIPSMLVLDFAKSLFLHLSTVFDGQM